MRWLPIRVFFKAAWLIVPAADATAACEQPIAQFVSIQGTVELQEASTSLLGNAELEGFICPGDSVRVGPRSRAALAFLDTGNLLRLDQDTTVQIRSPPAPGVSVLELVRGAIHFFSRLSRSLEVRTPFVNAAVEGTEFLVQVEADRTIVTVFEGRVSLTNAIGSLSLASNESAETIRGGAPQLRVIVRPRDAVQWAFYYDPVVVAEPLDRLQLIPESERDEDFYVRRASGLLAVGRIDEAQADLDLALSLSPGIGQAYALRTVVALAQNDRDQALALGREAVARSPQSSPAKIALSYALQASFDLEAARDTLLEAVQDGPNDALAWARLAELWMSLGDLDRALEAAEKASSLAPNLGRTNTVLGFAALARIDVSAAMTAFREAVRVESESPLARLGLGLAKIRQGALAAGRRDIEVAAALDPNDPLVRSYLGKAYYEEKRDELAASQYELAKELDPLDPTPWFYDAIRKQTINRPVAALQDLEKSIELNDNRAVYRSRLMLDEDLAARSASLGRVYRDLGFEQLALVEGWKSLNTDPGNYSAHRFLADSYSVLPRHEIARASELLQSQLLQPINVTPVQPQLAESDLMTLQDSGPVSAAFNEFNPLFLRNRFALQASGVAGGNDTLGGELLAAGVWNSFSFSTGGLHVASDGFRENNWRERGLGNIFAQASLSHESSVQGEFRFRTTESGDLGLRFEPSDFSPELERKERFDFFRLGMRHAFSQASTLIASVKYGQLDDEFRDGFIDPDLDLPFRIESVAESSGWSTEIRHLLQRRRFRVTSGAGHFQADRTSVLDLELPVPFPPFSLKSTSSSEGSVRQTNAYLYSLFDYTDQFTFVLGASFDFFDQENFERNQINPKFGIIWTPAPATTLRAAAFRTLHRSLVSSQTIEPTQVAGFNQFFDGVEGEEAWRYGLAVDQRLGRNIYAGAEFSRRDLTVPTEIISPEVLDLPGSEVFRFDWKEQFGRGYVYWAVTESLALSAEYLLERFDRDEVFGIENIVELETHRVPLSVGFFRESGLTAKFTATYLEQTGVFAAFPPVRGDDQFWVVDASIGFRLPQRYGLITLQAKNLFDERIRFQDTDPRNPAVRPRRLVLLSFTLAF